MRAGGVVGGGHSLLESGQGLRRGCSVAEMSSVLLHTQSKQCLPREWALSASGIKAAADIICTRRWGY